MSETFTIKPLTWCEGKLSDFMGRLYANTPFGQFEVGYHWELKDGDNPESEYRRTRRCFWGYCFAEYHDEDTFDCDSIAEGKRLAEEYWRERLAKALIPAKRGGA